MPRLNLGLPYSCCSGPDCRKTTGLQRCGACLVILYCGPEHQRADRQGHKTSCGIVKSSRSALTAAEAALRAHPGDATTPPNAFETAVGQFYTFHGTRPYMQARYDLAMAQLNLRTGEATQAALDNFLGMLRLCRGDNMGVRGYIPALYLRLGRDQDAYDFIKWYATAYSSGYNWRDVDLPFLDLHGADPLEPFDGLVGNIALQLSFLAAMTLLKIRLVLDLAEVDKAVKTLGDKAPRDRMELVQEHARGDILPSRRDIVDRVDYENIVGDLWRQAHRMYVAVDKANKHFWPAIKDPTPFANAAPCPYSFGSREEVVSKFRESWYSWAETPGAVEVIRSGELALSE